MKHTFAKFALAAFGLAGAAAGQAAVALSPRTSRDFEWILPQPVWRSTTTGIGLAHAGGEEFRAARDGLTLRVDTDGDGALDLTSKGETHHVVLRGKRADGRPLAYALVVRTGAHSDKIYYACRTTLTGTVNGARVHVIDQNCNGVLGEVGLDAFAVEPSLAAVPLSRVVNVAGQLYELEVTPDGTSAKFTPYAGLAGTLDVRSGLAVVGELRAAVVSNLDGTLAFDVTGHKPVRVPTGEYVFSSGVAVKGVQTGRLRKGRMESIVVTPEATAKLNWGAPLRAEFSTSRTGDKITIGSTVRYFGRAGEEWLPDTLYARTPQIRVFDAGEKIGSKPFETC